MHAGAEGCMNRTQGAWGLGPGARVGSKTTTFAPSSLDTCVLARSAFWPKPQAPSPEPCPMGSVCCVPVVSHSHFHFERRAECRGVAHHLADPRHDLVDAIALDLEHELVVNLHDEVRFDLRAA